ncbi:acetyltransferase [Campylobacter sputorum subsp. bubulus]|uniref:Acetyltransferase n=1 Tax=Campylobacter sputorum subsp. sputorum TaxID=32024 RepID=A0A381DIX0_9BACT|nr:N-acetyltransferase [Campylobacter sputorum]ASM35683.1 acetyltransferase [Campylobacter sputorum aubsp. sputorum RM3237]ASM37401.1 acetyltransferase [Campylobacter sputorum bv. faecalis CCUG 20703]KAB0582587.1 N-acetyltransferase [Campylobacter sputorum subsp. sputorum]QEL05875.1 acetyltransferase [Campylobacter sputorum subsp. sputorum]SUX07889.1 acetyltransferase [Campylobacter sputorum subsp. bubulus]
MIFYKKALLKDISSMQDLVKIEVEKGIILPRNKDEVATNIRSYTLCFEDDTLAGYGALHIHSDFLAEVRSLVVSKDYRNRGVGSEIVKKLLAEAKFYGVKNVMTLTYRDKFFINLGFKIIDKSEIPMQKIWADCIKCKHFPICDEIALIYQI